MTTKKWTVEEVFRWTPVRFAEETDSWEWIEKMLQGGMSAKDLLVTKRRLSIRETAASLMRDICTAGHLQLMRLALSVDAKLASARLDECGSTPLHVAAASRRDAAVRLLLEAGADYDVRDGSGRTALHAAAASGNVYAFRLLLDAGSDPESQDSEGNTAVHLACEGGHTSVLMALYDRGVSRCLVKIQLLLAAESCNVEGVRLALKQTSSWGSGWSDLHCVAIKGSGTAVRTLLAAGVDPNARDANGDTPLHAVAAAGCPGAAEALVEAGAHVDAADSSGSTPLHYAVRAGNLGVARVLLAAGADVEARDAEGDTPLLRAAARGCADAVAALVAAGARTDAANAAGRTAAQVARLLGHNGLISALLDLAHNHSAREAIPVVAIPRSEVLVDTI
ncbi:serine/threonine-protein phosphatase 6 regulatory ankyrin repeat subunit A-like [Schistocerca serialis cubense]|uniref:serine/threonine-protein phosphatase 6 regulatory ankyrin repeat subunit A-like n=1 Tax=Schistocerca serialis cubense TaxID=2023355 RepID=UPI00214EEEBE|nr:serine/threonine-protein phosphatase 6 regulatory ankyrin repeat subunit A-like [Schistocerca serialis cubense]